MSVHTFTAQGPCSPKPQPAALPLASQNSRTQTEEVCTYSTSYLIVWATTEQVFSLSYRQKHSRVHSFLDFPCSVQRGCVWCWSRGRREQQSQFGNQHPGTGSFSSHACTSGAACLFSAQWWENCSEENLLHQLKDAEGWWPSGMSVWWEHLEGLPRC